MFGSGRLMPKTSAKGCAYSYFLFVACSVTDRPFAHRIGLRRLQFLFVPGSPALTNI